MGHNEDAGGVAAGSAGGGGGGRGTLDVGGGEVAEKGNGTFCPVT